MGICSLLRGKLFLNNNLKEKKQRQPMRTAADRKAGRQVEVDVELPAWLSHAASLEHYDGRSRRLPLRPRCRRDVSSFVFTATHSQVVSEVVATPNEDRVRRILRGYPYVSHLKSQKHIGADPRETKITINTNISVCRPSSWSHRTACFRA